MTSSSSNLLTDRMPAPRIGLLLTGHELYWAQFPGLSEKCLGLLSTFRDRLTQFGDVVAPGTFQYSVNGVAFFMSDMPP
jgi:hypothetical protein